jgi:hypothetical protein
MTDFTVTTVVERLTDGSESFNVRFGDMVFHAVTESDATAFAHSLAQLVADHTVDYLHVAWGGRSLRE